MKAQFYILGLLLRYGPQHGYMLKQTVEDQISDFTQIKLPTIYYHLDKLNDKGFVSAEFQKDGNRPEKTVYSITEKGEKYFYTLINKIQHEELKLELPLDGLIFFQERVDLPELKKSLKKTIDTLEIKLAKVCAHHKNVMEFIPDQGKVSADIIFKHHICHLQAELDWLKEAESRL